MSHHTTAPNAASSVSPLAPIPFSEDPNRSWSGRWLLVLFPPDRMHPGSTNNFILNFMRPPPGPGYFVLLFLRGRLKMLIGCSSSSSSRRPDSPCYPDIPQEGGHPLFAPSPFPFPILNPASNRLDPLHPCHARRRGKRSRSMCHCTLRLLGMPFWTRRLASTTWRSMQRVGISRISFSRRTAMSRRICTAARWTIGRARRGRPLIPTLSIALSRQESKSIMLLSRSSLLESLLTASPSPAGPVIATQHFMPSANVGNGSASSPLQIYELKPRHL